MTLGTSLWPSLVAQICLQYRRPGFDHRVGRIPWKSEWQPTPVFLPGESHGLRSLEGYSPWSHKESDTNERLTLSLFLRPHSPGTAKQEEESSSGKESCFPDLRLGVLEAGAWQPLPGDPSVEQAGRKADQGWPGPPPTLQFQEGQEVCRGGGEPPPPQLAAFSVSGFTFSSAFSALILFGLGVIFPALHLFLCGTSKRGGLTGRGLTLCVFVCVQGAEVGGGVMGRVKEKELLALGFPGGSVAVNPPADAGDLGLILGPGRSPMLQSN